MATMIQPRFEKAALTYNGYASIQAITANKVSEYTPNIDPSTILDIGCGTGLLTKEIAKKYPNAQIDAMDVSSEMISELNQLNLTNVESFCMDYCTSETTKKYDLILSNAALHWMNVKNCLGRISQQLNEDALCYLAIFGAQTSRELVTLLPTLGRQRPIVAQQFITNQDLTALGEAFFIDWTVETTLITIPFASVHQLLMTQKKTGVNTPQKQDGLWTPRTIKALEQAFLHQYNQVQLTYEVHYCKGKKQGV